MIKKVVIVTLIFLGFFLTDSTAQSATATMRISVKVINGGSVETSKPQLAILSGAKKATLGSLKLKGIQKENVMIKNSSKIKLKDKDGNEIEMDIRISERGREDSDEIRFEGLPKGKMISNLYTGEVTTTIEYY